MRPIAALTVIMQYPNSECLFLQMHSLAKKKFNQKATNLEIFTIY